MSDDLPRYIDPAPGQPPAAYLVECDGLRPLAIVPSAAGAPRDLDTRPFFLMLEQAERLGQMVGDVARERLRVAAIMNAPEAEGQMKLAWKLAEAQFDAETAVQILRSERTQSPPPSDSSVLRTH